MISVFDTSISTLNVGDGIIMDAVLEEIGIIFSQHQQVRIPSHDKIGITSLSILRRSDTALVGGSNILSSHMNKYKQWRLSPVDAFFLRDKITLLGVGWRDYQGEADLYTRTLLRRILRSGGLHSVRDTYTEGKLRSVGINNVVNTGCPTMWRLTKEHCGNIPKKISTNVIFTLTDYSKNIEADRRLIEILKSNYSGVKFWIQGSKDFGYLRSFGTLTEDIAVVPPNLAAYNRILEENDLDYVGTRLHAGIRALQKGKRALIVGIDNRAKEKKKDFNLPVIDRDQIMDIESAIKNEFTTDIRMPFDKIKLWKDQFQS